MRVYCGYSDAERGDGTGPAMVVVVDDAGTRPLKHEIRHSPAGFSWGFGGSGPADLARSILADHLGFVPSPHVYQAFKGDRVARWPIGGAWSISAAEIDEWLAETGLRDELTENGGHNAI